MESVEAVVWSTASLLSIFLFNFSPFLGCISAIFFVVGWFFGKALLLSIDGFIDLTPWFSLSWLRESEKAWDLSKTIPIHKHECHSADKKACDVCQSSGCRRGEEEGGRERQPPWDGITIPTVIDEALQELLDLALKTYVHEWYFVEISEDPSFVQELRYQLRWLGASLLRRLAGSSLGREGPAHWLLARAAPVAIAHAHAYARHRRHLGTASCPGPLLEQRVLDFLRPTGSLHRAVYSREAELAYLRKLADFLVRDLTDTNRLSGQPANGEFAANPSIFLRELLAFDILLPVMDLLAEPDTLNLLITLLFDPTPMEAFKDPPGPRVPFLARLSQVGGRETTDSLVAVKLSEVMREPELLFAFMNFLKATKGPLHHLQFLLSADELQERLRQFLHPKDASEGGPMREEEAASHLHYEAWELYKNYVHEAAPERLPLPSRLVEDLKEVVEGKGESCPGRLEQPLLAAYQLVYSTLQMDQVVPFCQSEAFEQRLVGERPVLLNIAPLSQLKIKGKGKSRDDGFTMAKLQRKITGVFKASVEDGVAVKTSEAEAVTEEMDFEAPTHPVVLDPEDEIDPELVRELQEKEGLGSEVGLVEGGGDGERDLRRWRVRVPRVEPRRDSSSGKTSYVYILHVVPPPNPSTHPNHPDQHHLPPIGAVLDEGMGWLVDRRYGEWYVLESKLIEFHGSGILSASLPSKRTFVNKGRAFVESHRAAFEGFLQTLMAKPELKGSQLVHTFLTSPAELTPAALHELLNPWKAMKKGAGKLSRERGQHLTSFIRSFQGAAAAEAPTVKGPRVGSAASGSPLEGRSQASSGISGLSLISAAGPPPNTRLLSSLFGNNAGLLCEENVPRIDKASGKAVLPSSLYDLALFALSRVLSLSKWLFRLLVALRVVGKETVDKFVTAFLGHKLKAALHERKIAELVHLLRDALFYEENVELKEEEARQRREEALLSVLTFCRSELGVWPLSGLLSVGTPSQPGHLDRDITLFFEGLQNPRLNKQLSYQLLDLLLQDAWPQLSTIN